MTQETPHNGAPASLADGLAAIAGELRALAEAQRAEAGFAALMHAAVLFLLVGILARLGQMVLAWQQGRLPPRPHARPAHRRAHRATAHPIAHPESARRIRTPGPRRPRTHLPVPAESAIPAHASHPPASRHPGPGLHPARRLAPGRPCAGTLSKRAFAVEPLRALFVAIS